MKLLLLIALLCCAATNSPPDPSKSLAVGTTNPLLLNLPVTNKLPSAVQWIALPPSNNCFAAVLTVSNLCDLHVIQKMPCDGHLHLAYFPTNQQGYFFIAYFPTNSSNGLSLR